VADSFLCEYPHKLCFFSFENLISPSLTPKKSAPHGSIPDQVINRIETNKFPIQILLNGGLIYFQLVRGRGVPPHLQEVELGRPAFLPALLEDLALVRLHVKYWKPQFGKNEVVRLVTIWAHG
jgi:hypothetical protein